MGDYSQKTPVETLMVKRAGGVPNDLTGLLLCPRQSMRHSTSEPAAPERGQLYRWQAKQETSQRLRHLTRSRPQDSAANAVAPQWEPRKPLGGTRSPAGAWTPAGLVVWVKSGVDPL